MGKTETHVFREGTQGRGQASGWGLGSEGSRTRLSGVRLGIQRWWAVPEPRKMGKGTG